MTMERPTKAVEKPVVCIRLSGDVPDTVVHCIGWGLEEEGIPVHIGCAENYPTAVLLAKAAAQESRLHVGIGIHCGTGQIALHHRDLPDEEPLFTETASPIDREALIRLGKNAARLVKGNPFHIAATPAHERRDTGGNTAYSDALEQLVFLVLQELLTNFQER